MSGEPNVVIEITDYSPLEVALRKLKKAMLVRGVFKEMRSHEYRLKPSERKRAKQEKARRHQRKREARLVAHELARDPDGLGRN